MSNNMKKASFITCFSVASVWFGGHAGGGFATGNQATNFFVQYGWFAPIFAVLAMFLYAWVLRNAIVLSNNHGCQNYKEIFTILYSPYPKFEIVYEIFFYIMCIMAVSASVAGAATLLVDYGIPYGLGIVLIGLVTIVLVMFGAEFVSKGSAVMSAGILICIAIIFILGIVNRTEQIGMAITSGETAKVGTAIWNIFKYVGFQCVSLPAVAACAGILETKKNATRAMTVGFLMNGIALGLSCLMLIGWYNTGADSYLATGNTALPTIYICRQLGIPVLEVLYAITLFLCFVSTAVCGVYGAIPRFQNLKMFKDMDPKKSSFVIALIVTVVSVGISVVGLTNIVKYGYNYCGIIGVFFVIIPMLTVGTIKNNKFLKDNPEKVGE